MCRFVGCGATLLAISLFASSARGQEPLPEDMLLVRAQPSVFKVIAAGDLEIDYPKEVSLKNEPALAAAFDHRDMAEGAIDGTTTRVAYYWDKIAQSPATHLKASKERGTSKFEHVPYATGTAFAVSREGILLTNAHVIDRPDTQTPAEGDIQAVLTLLETPLANTFEYLERTIGGELPQESAIEALVNISKWVAGQSRPVGRIQAGLRGPRVRLAAEAVDFKAQSRLANPGKILGSGSRTLRREFQSPFRSRFWRRARACREKTWPCCNWKAKNTRID